MNTASFWNLIAMSSRDTEDCDEQAQKLTELLLKLEPEEIVDFYRHMRQRLADSYRWDLWAVAYIINGGCSDDGFEYFRGWLIARGKDYFEAALLNPENAAKDVSEGGEIECESILYAAGDAYEQKTGAQLPPSNIKQPIEPGGEEWEEDELDKLYPELTKKFGW